MKDRIRNWSKVLWRFLCSWQLPAALGLIFVIGLAIWAWPERSDWVVSADGREQRQAGQSPLRQVLWEQPQRIDNLLPQLAGKGSFITPRLADNGATLYFSFRPHPSSEGRGAGQADIYRSRFQGGKWQPAEPVVELNSPADDIGAVVTADGQELYFYSNRPGGLGGTDLYVSKRTGSGWGPPKNLGPEVNSSAHEYDPALGPDGLTLYFSSNRTQDMTRQAAEAATWAEPWATTLRGHPGLPQFDLYRTRRSASDAAWSAPEPLTDLNLPDANEGAPYVSRSGDFLYFASDRPARPGEPTNLDLYRARRQGDRFVDIENLGPGINTAAHETEPALSPEGFTLVFSSDRDQTHDLYRSTAQEVFAQTRWDTSRLQALSAVWWKILLLTFFLSALAIMLAYSRGWLLAKASAARFMLASLVLHVLVLLLLSTVPLVSEIAERAEQFQAEMSVQSFQGNLNQPQPAYEKVADLGAVAPAPVPELGREAMPLPQTAELPPAPMPDVPIPVSKFLPKQVPLETPSIPEKQTVELLRKTAPLRVAEQTSPVPEPVAAKARPSEQSPAEAKVALDRRAVDPGTTMKLETPAVQAKDSLRPSAASLQTVKQKSVEPSLALEISAGSPSRRQAQAAPKVVEALPQVGIVPGSVASAPSVGPVEAPVVVGRRDTSAPLDHALVPSPPAAVKSEPVFARRGTVPQAKPSGELADGPALPNPLATRVRSTIKAKIVEELTPAEAAMATGPAARSTTEKPLGQAEATLPRTKASLADPISATSRSAGPVPLAADMKPALSNKLPSAALPGKLGATLSDRPGLDPVAAPLIRRKAAGTHVAQAKNLADVVYGLRNEEGRKKAIEKLGGSSASEAAVERGLEWLAAHQHADGRWSLNQYQVNCKHPQCAGAASINADAAGTGLGLLPFLGAGHTHRTGKHQSSVARGLDWLLKNQRPDGALGTATEYRLMYGHGLAAIALCEAFGMTRDPSLREPAQKALDFIIRAQHAPSGGWRYTPNSPGDTSVLGWQVMALKSGEMAGLSVPPKTWEGIRRWLASVESKSPAGGLFGYMSATPTPAMTAQGLLCLQLIGGRRDDPRLLAAANYLLLHLPRPGVDTSYCWYHAIQAMYGMGGKHWKAWNEPLRDMLVATQVTKGPLAGSWDPMDARERVGGRICSTALRLLMLEVYYRRLPLYRQLEQ